MLDAAQDSEVVDLFCGGGGTQRENNARSESASAKHARQTHCKRGHEFTPENTYIAKRKGGERQERFCRECSRLRDRGRYQRRLAAEGRAP